MKFYTKGGETKMKIKFMDLGPSPILSLFLTAVISGILWVVFYHLNEEYDGCLTELLCELSATICVSSLISIPFNLIF